jgi:hypothetical protein
MADVIFAPSTGVYYHLDADGFRAIGLPMLLIVVLGFIMYLFYQLTRDFALQWTKLGMVHGFVLLSSVVQTVLSLFMFFSAAWNYALVNMFVSCFVILAVLMKDPKVTRYTFYALIFLNIVLLAGLPTQGMPAGILVMIRDGCTTWYNTYQDTMCVTGWLTALQFFATLTIAAQFANCFVFATFLLGGNASSSFSPIASSDGGPQHPQPVLHYEQGQGGSFGAAHSGQAPGYETIHATAGQGGYQTAGQGGYQSGATGAPAGAVM